MSRRARLKFRPAAFASGVAIAIITGFITMLQTPTLRTPVEELREEMREELRLGPGSGTYVRNPSGQFKPEDPCNQLYQLICSRTGVTKDPTGTVRPDIEGERMADEILETIVHEHPDFSSDEAQQVLVQEVYTVHARSRIETTFRWVKNNVERFIESQPKEVFSAAEKRQLRMRVRQIELDLPSPAKPYEDEPDILTKSDVFYEHLPDGRTRLRVGGAYFLSVHSWFNMVFTLAHEIGHSIDPCEVRNAKLSLGAYNRLTSCFIDQSLVALPQDRLECGEHDQLSETFADWIAVHITARTLRNYSTEFPANSLMNSVVNSVRDLCEVEDDETQMETDFHPPPEVRVDKIFGRNPEIRAILGCEPQPKATAVYCDFGYQKNYPTEKRKDKL